MSQTTFKLFPAFAAYEVVRKRHLAAYHRYSRWLTPLFQSSHDALARLRDIGFLPAEKSPTVSRLADSNWVAVEVILEEKQERELIPRLKRAGATGIITYPLNKVIP